MRELICGIPIRNDLESTKVMVDSLFNSTAFPFELVFMVGEGTNQETLDYLELEVKINYTRQGQKVRVINEQTKTPLEAYNKLFDLARLEQKDLLLTQTDVVFPKLYKRDWLELFYHIGQDLRVGCVVPINGGGMSGPGYVEGFRWVGGWCTYIPYNTVISIGKFDEGYLIGDGVDIDWSYRLYLANLQIVVTHYWVDHHMMNGRSLEGKYTHEELEEIKKKNRIYFRNKFGLEKIE
jgi:hypothetical protein